MGAWGGWWMGDSEGAAAAPESLMSAFNSDRLSLLLSILLPLHLLASSVDQGRSRSISPQGPESDRMCGCQSSTMLPGRRG